MSEHKWNLNILGYNIHGLSNKCLYPEFYEYICTFDVFALFETHVIEERIQQWKKYFKNFDIFWKSANRVSNFGRASGGCIYGVKKELKERGLTYSFNRIENVDVIKLTFYGMQIAILPVYIRGASWVEEFNLLKDFMVNHWQSNMVILGDTNTRIGTIQQEVDEIYNFQSDLKFRKSKDVISNSKGKQFIDFCDDVGMVILNGRTIGDNDGCLTFVSGVGSSVNDLCGVTLDLLKNVVKFVVESKPWSDHLPIYLNLKLEGEENSFCRLNLLPKLKWHERCKENYHVNLNRELHNVKNTKDMLTAKDLLGVIKAVVPKPRSCIKAPVFKVNWFNFKCHRARQKSLKTLRKFKNTNTNEDKNKYLEAKQKYKKICVESKKAYQQSLDRKINRVKNSKDWWKIAKEIRGYQPQIGQDIPAENFKIYFENLLNQQDQMIDSEETLINDNENENENLEQPFTLAELKYILRKAKVNKAPGIDRVPYEFFKNASEEFLSELTKLFNNLYDNVCEVDESFMESIIFPIFKKGDPNNTSNYRGISFLNCIAKILMGIINERLSKWIEEHNVLNEFQAGFRKRYSVVDNIYNLASIVHLKFDEKKKVYAFFVDFKAAFDKIPRKYLFRKLRSLGLPNKIINLIENIYRHTRSAVWTGSELSDFFETHAGVKQGCLLSPTLFTLYLEDLFEFLGGGLTINGENIRILLYADDIVILSDDIDIMQNMINRLEMYCDQWKMEVNLEKSEMLIFRKAGRISQREKWFYKGEQVKLASEFSYLGVILTPKMSFGKHVKSRNLKAKNSVNATWKDFLNKKTVTLKSKYKLFQSVSRSIQTYAAQIWGFDHFEEIDKLQRFFIKRILRLPESTPNYALTLETNAEDNHFYSLNLHMEYIYKTIFKYGADRLPRKLSLLILAKNIFWAKRINELGEEFGIRFDIGSLSESGWLMKGTQLLENLKQKNKIELMERAKTSSLRFYKFLNFNKGLEYFTEENSLHKMSYIFKVRSDILPFKANVFRTNAYSICTLCNMNEEDNLEHFMAKCPVLKEFRQKYFEKPCLNHEDLIKALNGEFNDGWNKLYWYVISSLKYRNLIINEFA